MKLVSVVIPAYNCENTIQECIVSIQDNTYREFEIVVINDGSTDHTLNILNSLQNIYHNIRIINIENSGVSYARNMGIKESKGDLITFVDSDDTVEKDYLGILVKEVSDCDLVVCNYKYIGKGKKIEYISQYGCYSIEEFNKCFMLYFDFDLLNSPCNKIYKKQIIVDNLIMFPKNKNLGEDFFFNIDYLQVCSKIKFIPNILYNYYINPSSLTTSLRDDYLQIQMKLIERVKMYLVSQNCFSAFNSERVKRLHNSIYVSFLQEIFQGKLDKREKRFYFENIVNVFKTDKEFIFKDNGLQSNIIIFLLKTKNYFLMSSFFTTKKILRNIKGDY